MTFAKRATPAVKAIPKRKRQKYFSTIEILPSAAVKGILERSFLPVAALDLRQLVDEAEAKGVDPHDVWTEQFKTQIDAIFERLGEKNSDRRNWQLAFCLLAISKLGLGRVTCSPKRDHKNTLRPVDNDRLMFEMISRLAVGYKKKEAAEEIAANTNYLDRSKGNGPQYSGVTGRAKGVQRILRQWHRLESKYLVDFEDLVNWLTRSPWRQRLNELDLGSSAPQRRK